MGSARGPKGFRVGSMPFTVTKLECLRQAMRLNISARDNKIGLWCYFVGLHTEVMINRNRWGNSYFDCQR